MADALRVVLVGAGNIAQKHLRAFRQFPEKLRLVGVCDVNRAAADAVAKEFALPAGAVFEDDTAAIAFAGREAQAVDLCTIHDQHHRQTLDALGRGLHVLLEKPMAVSMAQCVEMEAAARQAGRVLMVAHNQRYKANYRALRRIIRAGELGQIRAARAESAMSISSPPSHWVYDGKRAGGGVAISLGLHRLDLMRWFCGDFKRVISAACRTWDKRFYNGAEDYCMAMLELEGGGVVTLFFSYSAYRSPWGESFMIYGEKGTAHAHPTLVKYNDPVQVASEARNAGRVIERAREAFTPLELDTAGLPTGDMTVDELLHFEECVRTGAKPVSSGREMLGTMAALFAVYESARRGGAVEIAEIWSA